MRGKNFGVARNFPNAEGWFWAGLNEAPNLILKDVPNFYSSMMAGQAI
jgi:hypothetical protein